MLSTHTQHSDIDNLLEILLREIYKILGKKLVGMYLYGSLVWGDFDYDSSDIDVMIAVKEDLNEKELTKLKTMHKVLSKNSSKFNNRIDIFYIELATLKHFKTSDKIVVFFPEEPLHPKEAGIDGLMNVYSVQEKGITLFGPGPHDIITHISKQTFIQAVKEYTKRWTGALKETSHTRENQAFIILTMCRNLYAITFGHQVSKKFAANWEQQAFPEWRSLIQNAITWREKWRDEKIKDERAFSETKKFVKFTVAQVSKSM